MGHSRFDDMPRNEVVAAIERAIARMTPDDRVFVKSLPEEERLVVMELFVRFDANFVEEEA